MQSVSKRTIMPSVNLTCITTDKFKTGFISINLLTELSSKTAGKNALLPLVLRRGTSEHPDITSISEELDELYGARIEPIVRKKGETLCVGLYASFVDDDFVPRGENILERTISLLGEMLLSPATRGGLLLEKYVEGEKNNLIDEIRNEKNDKIRYAIQRMIETMCKNEPYGVNSMGTEATVSAITNRSLTKHYRELISTSPIEIIYCGAANVDKVAHAFLDSFSSLPRTGAVVLPETKAAYTPFNIKVNTVVDKMDVAQGKLTIGYRLGKSMLYPDYAALMVFNAVFGGSVTSKLFLNVREKLSLCYYASSMIDKLKGIMVVYSGVEFENFSQAYDEISKQLDHIRYGNVSGYEFTSAKKYVATSILSRLDSAGGIEDYYLDSAISGSSVTPEELAKLVDKVTPASISNIARNVVLDTVHYITSSGGDGFEAKIL